MESVRLYYNTQERVYSITGTEKQYIVVHKFHDITDNRKR